MYYLRLHVFGFGFKGCVSRVVSFAAVMNRFEQCGFLLCLCLHVFSIVLRIFVRVLSSLHVFYTYFFACSLYVDSFACALQCL